jgi:hypothetical protein
MKCPACQQTMANVDLERGPVGNPTFGPLIVDTLRCARGAERFLA